MIVLIWATVLFAVRSSHANTVASPAEIPQIAEAGLCVVIPCYFTTDPGFTLASAVWYKCEQGCNDSDIILRLNNTNAQAGFRGRVSLLEPGLNQWNCSIIINDLAASDSGSYQLRVRNGTREYAPCRAIVAVKVLTQKPTVMIPPLTEGQQTTLTCNAPGLCSGSAPEITWMWRGRGENDSHITGSIADFKTENLTSVTQRHSSTLTFNPSAEHHSTKITCKVSFTNNITTEETVTLNVTYVKPKITGNTTVKKGYALNLTCSVESFPLALIIWSKVVSNKNLHNETKMDLKNDTEKAHLIIPNMTAEHSGQYMCTAKHLNRTVTVYANVTVTSGPKILNSSRCINRSEVLTCMCISKGFPLPTIEWPLLKSHAEYSVITTVSNNTVNSTIIILTVKGRRNTAIECVSNNESGKTSYNLTIHKEEREEEVVITEMLRIVTQLEIIIAFLIGVLLSAILCCLVRKCHRKKQRTYKNLAETVEMVTSHEHPLIDGGQAVEDDQGIDQEAAEAGGAVAEGISDVEYSNLDFSLIKRPAEAERAEGTTETEYAEIKKEKADKRRDGEGKAEEVMIGEDEETKPHVPKEEEGEDVAVYSNVQDVLDLIRR